MKKEFFGPCDKRPKKNENGKVSVPRRWMRLVDTPACLDLIYKVWAGTGYGAKQTKVIHRWPVKSVLRRAGLRWD